MVPSFAEIGNTKEEQVWEEGRCCGLQGRNVLRGQHETFVSRNRPVHTVSDPGPCAEHVGRETFSALHPGPSHLHIHDLDASSDGHLVEILWDAIVLERRFLLFLSAFLLSLHCYGNDCSGNTDF